MPSPKVRRPNLAYSDGSLPLEEGDGSADVALVGRAGERRQPPFDPGSSRGSLRVLGASASFRQAEGCCSETHGDTPTSCTAGSGGADWLVLACLNTASATYRVVASPGPKRWRGEAA